MWFISVKIAPHYHNIINPEQGQPHLTLLGRITTAVSHFILNHFMLYSLVRQCRKYPCRPAQEKFCWTLKLFDGICLYCPNFRDLVYIQGTFYFLGPYWAPTGLQTIDINVLDSHILQKNKKSCTTSDVNQPYLKSFAFA